MTDPHAAHAHAGPDLKIYLAIFAALCGFTLLSFVVNLVLGQGSISGMGIIMLGAVFKATLVAMYFMHLRFETRTLGLIALTPLLLCVFLLFMLIPDTSWRW